MQSISSYKVAVNQNKECLTMINISKTSAALNICHQSFDCFFIYNVYTIIYFRLHVVYLLSENHPIMVIFTLILYSILPSKRAK